MSLYCMEHDQSPHKCEESYDGWRCPYCGKHDPDTVSNGHKGRRASYQHLDCAESPDGGSAEWDASEYADCRELAEYIDDEEESDSSEAQS